MSNTNGRPFMARVDMAWSSSTVSGGIGVGRFGRAVYRDFAVGDAGTK